MENIKIESIIQDGDYYHVSFADWDFLHCVIPFELHIHKLHLKDYYGKQTCNECIIGLFSNDDIRALTFEQLTDDISCRDTRDIYLKDLAREMLADKSKNRKQLKDIENLSRKYSEAIQRVRFLEGELTLKESMKVIYDNHITQLR